MLVNKRGMLIALVIACVSILACDATQVLKLAQATATPTRTPRATFTPLPTATNTPVPTQPPTATKPPPTATVRPATARPPTARPATAAPKPPPVVQPTTSPYEFHANPPTCSHSGLTFIKGIVYNDRNDPGNRYIGALVALGPPDAGTIYQVVKSNDYGEYTFVLGDQGQARPGTWAVWLVDPSHKRKSDISGTITTNNLGPDNPAACWFGSVDFWK